MREREPRSTPDLILNQPRSGTVEGWAGAPSFGIAECLDDVCRPLFDLLRSGPGLPRAAGLEAGLARPGPETRVRRRHRGRRRAWARDRLVSREPLRHHQCRGGGEGLSRQRQRRPQHHDHPLELPASRQHPVLRTFDETLGRARAGHQLQRHGEPARRPEPLPLGWPARRLRAARQCHDDAWRRCRTARPGRRPAPVPSVRLRQRPLPDPGRPPAAPRRLGAS